MKLVKRLDTFLLQRFLPLLLMTFCITLFIVMMQFLWRSIEDLVGKGLGFDVIAELFWYAALTMVPTALPLAILLASLMTFGNLGEKLELTAMKSAGISLFRIMAPLIVVMVMIAVGAFFFQNNVIPVVQTKMYTLLVSMKQKSPEVEIPEGTFYDQIPNMNLYVEHKNRDSGVLYGMILYDASRGMDNSRIILADSGSISFTHDKKHLFLHLHSGELFENFRDNSMGVANRGYMPFRRESFSEKKVYLAFDANFNRVDEGGMRSQYIGMNASQLSHAIDSIQEKVDSIGKEFGTELKTTTYMGVPYYTTSVTKGKIIQVPRRAVHPKIKVNVDSIMNAPTPAMAKSYISQALMKVKQRKMEFEFKSLVLSDQERIMRRHDIELQKKFTLSLACLIFFFIGAPLGAIIKKGGIGTPLVISVFLFVIYFIFDNMGYKMAKDGKLEVWEGIWLSSAIILPLGIFFTYKAVGDSTVFDFDQYKRLWKKLFRISEFRHIAPKEIVMDIPDLQALLTDTTAFENILGHNISQLKKQNVIIRMFRKTTSTQTDIAYDALVNRLSYIKDKKMNGLLNCLPMYLNGRNISAAKATLSQIEERLHQLIAEDYTSRSESEIINENDSETQSLETN